jgi:hypothetical protein
MNEERKESTDLNGKENEKCQSGNLKSEQNEQSRKENRIETGLGSMWHKRKEDHGRKWKDVEV